MYEFVRLDVGGFLERKPKVNHHVLIENKARDGLVTYTFKYDYNEFGRMSLRPSSSTTSGGSSG
jgi:hypothetical protein